MRKKRLFYLALALIAVCIFTGVISAQNRGKQISVWIGWSELLPVYQKAAADFQAQTGTKVEVLAFPLREFERKLAVSIPAGNAPDIFVTSSILSRSIAAGYIALPPKNVQEFIEKSFDPYTLKINTFNGKIYGVPQIGIARVLYWNKDLFAEAG